MFFGCENLKEVTCLENSRLAEIGDSCFRRSGVRDVELPAAVREIRSGAFDDCKSLAEVWLETGCIVDVHKRVAGSVAVLPSKQSRVGDQFLWKLAR